ncbi:MAG: hypothetical protein ILO53_02290 [Clostridia bacterium]|nr:hypothetical protein [Clostridia bacterium]
MGRELRVRRFAENKSKIALIIAVGLLVLSLIPLYALGMHAHPAADDYSYGLATATVWQETHSFGAVLREAMRVTVDTYGSWQGNYAAIFLMCLQPAIFGSQWYPLTAVILLTAFVLAMLFFFVTALRRLLNADRTVSWTAASLITFCALQFTYVPADSFYWFNGGIYYTFFFSVSLFLYGLIIIVVKAKSPGPAIAAAAGALPLAFLVGGSNYSTALYTVVILCVLCVLLFAKRRRSAWPVLALTAVVIGALLLSILAPGNTIRQAASGEGAGVVKAFLYSFAYGGYSLANGLSVPVLALWVLLAPILYKLTGRTSYRFRCPLLVLILTFGMYCSQGTALFYARGLRMPPRMSNIIYFSAYLLIGFNLTYLLGWARRRFGGKASASQPGHPSPGQSVNQSAEQPESLLDRSCESLVSNPKHGLLFAAIMALVFIVGCVGLCRVSENESGGAAFSLKPFSVSAAYSLLSGEAAEYDAGMRAREDYLSSLPEGADVTVEELPAYPEALVHSEISEDPEYFGNAMLAGYYDLGSVTLVKK